MFTHFVVQFSDHQPVGRVHTLLVVRQLLRRLPGEPVDGRRPEQHRQDPKIVGRSRPVSSLSNPPWHEVHPLSWNHSQGKTEIKARRGIEAQINLLRGFKEEGEGQGFKKHKFRSSREGGSGATGGIF